MKSAFLILLCLFTPLVGCVTLPATTQNIKGLYALKDLHGGVYFEGESITLGDGTCSYEIFTDVTNDPRLRDNPKNGTFTRDGCLLEFRFRDGTKFHRIFTPYYGRFLIWSPKEYEEYLRTGRVSHHVLFQQPSK